MFTATTTRAVLNAIDIFNPVYGNLAVTTPPAPNTAVNFNDTETQDSYGVYFNDQVDLTERFKLRVGGRFDSFKQSFVNRAGAAPPRQDVTQFSPQVGLKFTALGERITGTAALFRMDKTNVITADPANAGFSLAIGKAESQGFEVEVTAEFTDTFRANLAYAYADAESATHVLDRDFRRVVAAGAPLINIPEHSLNLLMFKDLNLASRTLTLGGGVQYVDERLGETGTTFMLPSYSLVRLQASYEFTDNLDLTGEVTNLLDEEFYPASFAALWVAPGAPQQFQLRARYSF